MELLKDLYIHELKGLYCAEKQIIEAFPMMVRAATNGELASDLEEALEHTKEHAVCLKKILLDKNETIRGSQCEDVEEILAKGIEMIKERGVVELLDAGLISTAHRVEHLKMIGYDSARIYAALLGDTEAEKLLQASLEDEEHTDKKLMNLARATNAATADGVTFMEI